MISLKERNILRKFCVKSGVYYCRESGGEVYWDKREKLYYVTTSMQGGRCPKNFREYYHVNPSYLMKFIYDKFVDNILTKKYNITNDPTDKKLQKKIMNMIESFINPSVEDIEKFREEFNPDEFNWEEDSWILPVVYKRLFNTWFIPDKFNFKDAGIALASCCYNQLEPWLNNFDKDKFDYDKHYDFLLLYCKNYFEKWWNKEKINWKEYSGILCENYNDYFKIWWDIEKFNWEKNSDSLIDHCLKYFNKWWNPEKFDWEKNSSSLAEYCSKYFEKWWDPIKFNWVSGLRNLIKYCKNYFNIWWPYIENNPNIQLGLKDLIILLRIYNNYVSTWEKIIFDRVKINYNEGFEIDIIYEIVSEKYLNRSDKWKDFMIKLKIFKNNN